MSIIPGGNGDTGSPMGSPYPGPSSESFTRGTSEDTINQFNQWLRNQPYWQQIASQSGGGDWNDRMRSSLRSKLLMEGVDLPKDFDIDKGGNFNQTSRLKQNLGIAGLIAGGAFAMNPALFGLAGAPTATAVGAPALEGGATLGANLGSAGALGAGGTFPAATGGGTVSKVGGFLSKLFGGGSNKKDNPWADLSSTLGAASQAEASNRYANANLAQRGDALRFDAAREQRAAESDAMRKVMQSSYILGGGAKPMNFKVNSGTMPDFGFGPPVISDTERTAASNLQNMVMSRLTPEGALKATDPTTFTQKSAKEKGTDWASLIASGFGTAKNFWGK